MRARQKPAAASWTGDILHAALLSGHAQRVQPRAEAEECPLRDASEAEDQLKFHDLIQPWNDQLVALGSEIHQARVNHVDQLRAHLNPGLFQAEAITIRYKSSLEGRGDLGDYANLLKERLGLRLKNEIAAGYSLVGPHRDDLKSSATATKSPVSAVRGSREARF